MLVVPDKQYLIIIVRSMNSLLQSQPLVTILSALREIALQKYKIERRAVLKYGHLL